LSAQVFNPYGRPYALPIPTIAQPSAVTAAPDLNFPEVSDGGLLALADAESNFALRFSGGRHHRLKLKLTCRVEARSAGKSVASPKPA